MTQAQYGRPRQAACPSFLAGPAAGLDRMRHALGARTSALAIALAIFGLACLAAALTAVAPAAGLMGFVLASVALLGVLGRAFWHEAARAHEAGEAAEMLREALEALPAGVVIYDAQERLMVFNAAAADLNPSLRTHGIGRTYEELANETARRLEALGHGPQPVAEWVARFRRKDMQRIRQTDDGRWFDWSERATPAGRTVGLRVDVTEIKKKELELEQARTRYQSLVDSLTDMVYATDQRGFFTYVSPGAADLLGVPSAVVLGTPFRDWVVPEDVERVMAAGRDFHIAPNREMRQLRFRMKAADGTVKAVELRYRKSVREDRFDVQVGVIRDISELERARIEYQSLVDSLADVAYKLDVQTGRFTFVSASATEFFGKPPEEMVGTNYLDIIAPQSREMVGRLTSREYDPADPGTLTRFCMIAKGGEIRHVEVRARRRIDENGHMISTGLIRDVEERVRLERRVEEQVNEVARARAEYQSLVDSLSDVVYKMDVETGLITFASASAADFFGSPVEQLVGSHFLDRVDPEYRAFLAERTTREYVASEPPSEHRFRMRAAGGHMRYVEARAQRRIDERGKLVITGVVRDVEQRVQLERRLERETERLRSVVESSGALIVLANRDLDVVMVNSGFTAATGIEPGAAISRPLRDILELPLDHAPAEPAHFAVKLTDRQGQVRLVAVTATPVTDAEGNVSSVVLLGVDDTDRRDAEQALHDAERFATVGEMAGTMAHELSQPLQVINIACASALEEMTDAAEQGTTADQEYVQQKLDRIAQQVETASRVVGDLRAFVRGTNSEKARPFDPASAIRNAVSLTAHGIREAGALLGQSVAAGLPQVSGDIGRLEQVLVNLLNNARDAEGRHIDVIADKVSCDERDFVRIAVEDSGHGIAQDVLPRLFATFVTTKARGKGTGLGLRVCRRIVEEMGGSISAANRPQGGARFEVLLPAMPAATVPPNPPQNATALTAH